MDLIIVAVLAVIATLVWQSRKEGLDIGGWYQHKESYSIVEIIDVTRGYVLYKPLKSNCVYVDPVLKFLLEFEVCKD